MSRRERIRKMYPPFPRKVFEKLSTTIKKHNCEQLRKGY